jgi:ribosome modulation factor
MICPDPAYAEGTSAFSFAVPLDNCPYLRGDPRALAWQHGWLDAQGGRVPVFGQKERAAA